MAAIELVLGSFVGLLLAWTIYFEFLASSGKFGDNSGEGETPFHPSSPCLLDNPANPGCLETLTCWKAKWSVTWRRQFIFGFFAAVFMTMLYVLFGYRTGCDCSVSYTTIFFVSWFVAFMGQRVVTFLKGSHDTDNEICKFFVNKVLPKYNIAAVT